MQAISFTGRVGTDDGPPSTDAYKRAVYKQPPRHFAVQVLPPQKFGNAFSYGMLITPLNDSHDRHSIISGSSGSSGSSSGSQTSSAVQTIVDTSTTAPLATEYEVWRRWEDCLYFQDLLEAQYSLMSKEKRARLLAGKGVKKNGMYEHEDPIRRLHRAASFESLPPGPDPNMIAKDVHELLPRLTKKGTVFKASKETIEQRGREFKALIETLLHEGDDVPALIKELRQLRVVRDFFGFWRRDQDRIEKQLGKDVDRSTLRGRSESLGSRASSIFSSSGSSGIYFNPSNLSLQLPSPNAPEQAPTNRSPRRPAFMQSGKLAINLVPPSPNEAGPSNESATPRRRAQTLQDMTSAGPGLSVNTSDTELRDPPVSAPANMNFTDAMDNGYSSDSASTTSNRLPLSPRSFSTASSSGSPPSSRITRSGSPRSHMEIRYSDIILAEDPDAQRKSKIEDKSNPVIVDLEDGDGLPLDADEMFVGHEHGYLVSDSIESRLGGYHALQHLTIKEEDESELDDEMNGFEFHDAQSSSQPSGSSTGHETAESMRFSIQSSFTDADSHTERPNSAAWSSYSVPAPSDRAAAAHAEALRALTGGRASITMSGQHLAPAEAPSARSSVLTTTSGSGSGSGSSSRSTNSGNAHSSDTQSSVDVRPYSYQSSIASCEDIDRKLSSSPIILHSPLLEDDEFEASFPTEYRQSVSSSDYRPHDSISSVRTFMTESSMDTMIPPPRQPHPSPARFVGASPSTSRPHVENGTTLAGSDLRNSRPPVRTISTRNPQDGVNMDAYFYGFSPVHSPTETRVSDPREVLNASLTESESNRSRPSHNRFAGQFSPPTSQQQPTPPGLYSNVRNPRKPVGAPSPPMRSVSPSPSTSSYAPSIVASMSEESGMNAVSIKAIYGEHIVAFRIDKSSSLADVRDKLWHKLADQQDVTLPDSFSLAFKPPGPGRVQQLRKLAGRARSSSASSVGMTDPSSLRIMFSQRDWLDAVGSCPPGAKLTLHVLNR
ncbi:hypothetical protein ACEPAG_7032 [Sanghuangporus baumii]